MSEKIEIVRNEGSDDYEEIIEEEEEEEEEEDDDEVDYTHLSSAEKDGRTKEEIPLWDSFPQEPREEESISMAETKLVDFGITIVQLITYVVTFCGVLFGAVLSKSIILLMTSQLTPNKTVTVRHENKNLVVEIPTEERYLWMWALFVSYSVPEIGTFIRSVRHVMFKSHSREEIKEDGKLSVFVVTYTMETLQVIGMAMLVFEVLPNIDVIRGVMITNCVCLVPALLSILSNNERGSFKKVGYALAIIFQLTGYFLWPSLDRNDSRRRWIIPPTLFLISCGWWINFVPKNPKFRVIRVLGNVKDVLKNEILLYRYYVWISLYKVLAFGVVAAGILAVQGTDLKHFFENINTVFHRNRTIVGKERIGSFQTFRQCNGCWHHQWKADALVFGISETGVGITLQQIYEDQSLFVLGDKEYPIQAVGINVWWIIGCQALSAYLCYGFSKFAYKVMISSFSFALPVIFVVPVTVELIIVASGFRNENPGVFSSFLYNYLFFNIPDIYSEEEIFVKQFGWMSILWLISQIWIAMHVWSPKCERLSRTEKLFATPMYSSYLVDQSVVLNRRRDEIEYVRSSTEVPHIIACATMWHESKPEMLEMLKSVMRMDLDQFLRNSAKEKLNPDEETNCYTYETHVFFDDAFEVEDEGSPNMVINSFVKNLMGLMEKAEQAVYRSNNVSVSPPKKTGTPYGGRLTYVLPCGTMFYVHLKNKDKIRHRKRWSQVMYMYYLLGYNLMEKDTFSTKEKLEKAKSTFILALDGDIDFKPQAVLLLVDLMKKNSNLGAACGRIHPIGSGIMVWYQTFEYAIGHWLQKATEHMIGCVLCSPGCFSLFRSSALMAPNVMKTYTTKAEEARHYVQYDQGEDRWLCTLLLQRGYRVEYCAASDAYTHCPESFNEFYTQRRRWVPSTMANILDLLYNYKNVVQVNNDISMMYICYQLMLMVGTVLGPGTIFLLLVSAFNAAFKIDNWTSFYCNMIPILAYIIICLTMPGKIQLISALILSGAYALIMMAVLVGMCLQIIEDGFLAPSTIFLYIVAGEIIIAGLVHPQEFFCLVKGPIYYVTIPSMYLLLIIYSVCNLNVVVWGTRELAQKKTKAELENEKKEAEEEKRKAKAGPLHSILGGFGKKKEQDEGGIEFSLGNIFRCMLFTHPKSESYQKELTEINNALGTISKRMDNIERGSDYGFQQGRLQGSASKPSLNLKDTEKDEMVDVKETEQVEIKEEDERDDVANPYWIEDKVLEKSKLVVMDMNEINFWKELIKKYLAPLQEDKKKKEEVAKALKELRDKMVVTFFMLNALFVIVVFLLQLNKSAVHFNWPLAAKVNMSINENKEIRVTKTYLQLEPVGVMFILFFAVILVIQFLAMLMHRFETLCHLISSTPMLLPWKEKKKTFEWKVKNSKDKLLNKKHREGSGTMLVTEEKFLDVKELTDSIFEDMKRRDMETAEKAEQRRASLKRLSLNPNDFEHLIARFRKSNFSKMKTLEEVTEEETEL